MSNKTPSAKKPKTASAHKNKLIDLAYLAIGVFALVSLACIPSKQGQNSRQVCFDSSCIRAEKAVTSNQRTRGLSGRQAIPDDTGMLFIFEKPARQCMWMKDMRFNLDMVWLDQKSRIINIVKNASPDTFPESFCAADSKYVLELNAGKADRLNLRIGDLVRL